MNTSNLVGKNIKHKMFGDGVIKNLEEEKDYQIISIKFGKEVKRFIYPDVFKNFVTIDDKELNEIVVEEIRVKEEHKRAEILEKQDKYKIELEAREKIRTENKAKEKGKLKKK